MEDFTGLRPEEIENLNQNRGTAVEDFSNAVRSKLGDDWNIFIDWKSICQFADTMDRQMLEIVYQQKLPEYTKEFQNLTAELTKALKDKVSKKLVTFTMGEVPRGDNFTVLISDVVNIKLHKGMLCAEYPPDPMYNTNPATITLWIEWHFFPSRRDPETIVLTSEETGFHGSSGSSQKDYDEEEEDRHAKASKPVKKEKVDSKADAKPKEKAKQKCWTCKGTGKERCMQCKKGMKSSTTTCSVCKGNWEKNCHKCKGAGEN